MNYPDTSKLLTLSGPLDEGCSELGDAVAIKTRLGTTVQGIIAYADSNNKLRVSYDAVKAGFSAGYELEDCDIVYIRCPECCDEFYFELTSCPPDDELPAEDITNAIQNMPEVGTVFLYAGTISNPDCIYRFTGTGDYTDPANWQANFADTIPSFLNLQRPGNLYSDFIDWLSTVFSGTGISFNSDGTVISVTVVGGGNAGASSFSFDYKNGWIRHDANDGTGPKQVDFIKGGSAPPAQPDSFFYVDELNELAYINYKNNWLALGEFIGQVNSSLTNCRPVLECVYDNLIDPPQPDTYYVNQLTKIGDYWNIQQVVYGQSDSLVADFTDCSDAATIEELAGKLNVCPQLPDEWAWKVTYISNSPVLTLCVPSETCVQSISWGYNGIDVQYWANCTPDVQGSDFPSLCPAIIQCIDNAQDVGRVWSSLSQTTTDVEAEYPSMDTGIVMWTQSDGTQRRSYKSEYTGWSHPVTDGSGIPEPANDGNTYARQFEVWVETLSKAEIEAAANEKMHWRNEWLSQAYLKNDVVRDGDWTMVANKDTSDRPSPTLINPTQYTFAGNVEETTVTNAGSVAFGTRFFNATQDYAISGYRIYAVAGNSYRVFTRLDPSGTPIINEGINFDATQTGWVEFNIVPVIVPLNTEFDLIANVSQTDNSDTVTTIPYNYDQSGGSNNLPVAGEIAQGNNDSEYLRIHHTDNSGTPVDRQVFLESLVAGDRISTPGMEWVIEATQNNADHVRFTVSPSLTTNDGAYNVDFTQPTPTSLTIMEVLGYWPSSNFPNNEGLRSVDGEPEIISTAAYGADILVQEVEVSEDWDLLAYNNSSANSTPGQGDKNIPQYILPVFIDGDAVDINTDNTVNYKLAPVGNLTITDVATGNQQGRAGMIEWNSSGGTVTWTGSSQIIGTATLDDLASVPAGNKITISYYYGLDYATEGPLLFINYEN